MEVLWAAMTEVLGRGGGGDFQWGLTIGCEDEGFESENGVDNCFTQMRVGFVFLLI